MTQSNSSVEAVAVIQADRDARTKAFDDILAMSQTERLKLGLAAEDTYGEAAGLLAIARVRIASEQATVERCAKIAEGYWVEADYDLVGVHDADKAMELCRQTAAAIRSHKGE